MVQKFQEQQQKLWEQQKAEEKAAADAAAAGNHTTAARIPDATVTGHQKAPSNGGGAPGTAADPSLLGTTPRLSIAPPLPSAPPSRFQQQRVLTKIA